MEIESGENHHSLSRYDFDLPESLIAQEPASNRSGSRCIFAERGLPGHQSGHFTDLIQQLNGDELLVYNDTRVIPARIHGNRSTGGKVEIFILRPARDGHSWIAWISPSKRIKPGEVIFGPDVEITVHEREGSSWRIEWPSDISLEEIGEVPLPPYIRRDVDQPDRSELDRERYQTVFAKTPGAVAAPTAGLHFDETLLDQLKARGVERCPVTLHVGPGTFKPIESEDLRDHKVDPEWFSISRESRQTLHEAQQQGRPIIAVGTTSLRVLETLEDLSPGEEIVGETDLTILPGYQFRHVDGLLTNFHLPGSSLLVLVSCFHGVENTLEIYRYAIENEFRFYSYGDCMLIKPGSH
ncbi:MAG: tRNA preQ1(34) S-adenosylmethionine ribosyltransferase-isomerase QueA [Planctomycetia bacterium TMED53]|nr:MAG: tRNA preQ1(34) S-adenosylmethionine ribosyltransferase-isomerase QueA [Planctomycetia bacterium TMED53]